MACMLPGIQMTAQERACCRMMQGDCGHMQMQAGNDCCQKVPQSTDMNAIGRTAPAIHPIMVVSLCLATWNMAPSRLLLAGGVAHPDASPPKSPPAAISILRI